MRGIFVWSWLAVAISAPVELLDQIAATVGNRVVTERQLIRELRLTAFESNKPVDLSPKAKRAALERLIERELLRRDLELSRFPKLDPSEGEKMLRDTKARLAQREEVFRTELERFGLTEDDLKEHLMALRTWSRFLDFRFRQGIQVFAADIEEYYRTRFIPEARGQGLTIPPFDEVRDRIEEAIVEERLNAAVDQWVKETRQDVRVEVREEVLK
jgi:hypothetical protein